VPELPEVETLRRSLEPGLLGRRITRATLFRRDILVAPGDPAGGFSRNRAKAKPASICPEDLLQGARIAALHRRGKQLALLSDAGPLLVIHLGMSGQVRLAPPDAPALSHTHAAWDLDSGDRLLFRDPRRFGGLWTLPSHADLEARWQALGPDAASVTADQLAAAAKGSARPIKALLLDQAAIAGVGNIYADEALFLARISPRRLARRLKAPELDRLATAIRQTLAAAIAARGSTLRDYRDASGSAGEAQLAHQVYDRAGHPCPACGRPLRGTRLAQRATVYCPSCQR
jgi:formamidopyrimidine-DNA glycosylase